MTIVLLCGTVFASAKGARGAPTRAGLASADAYLWPSYNTAPGPGGFATIVIDHPRHGSNVQGPDTAIRLHTDNPNAALRVQLDGKDVDRDGRPHMATTGSATDYPQWEFMDRQDLVVPVRGMAPGLHRLVICSGGIGTSLPQVNEQALTFVVK